MAGISKDIGGGDMDNYMDSITLGLAGSGVSVANEPFNASSGSRFLVSLPFRYGGCAQLCIQWSTGRLAIRSRESSGSAIKSWSYLNG